jgi:type II secretory pathway predicted ATPase ExeA
VNPRALLGYRGLGKTVLIEELAMQARERGWHSAVVEVDPDHRLEQQVLTALDDLVTEIAPTQAALRRFGDGIAKATKTVKASTTQLAPVTLELAMTSGAGTPQVGQDLHTVLRGVGELALSKGAGIAIFLDELHEPSIAELRSLAIALQALSKTRDVVPVAVVGAGLPHLDARGMKARTYGERMFEIWNVNPLSPTEIADALRVPAGRRGRSWDDEAVALVVAETQGYPFFVQRWGLEAWNITFTETISATDVKRAAPRVYEKLDTSFYRQRLAKLSPSEANYVERMAALDPEDRTSIAIAKAMGKNSTSDVSTIRDSLIDKGMIEATGHGHVGFTVPGFAGHFERAATQRRGLGFS